jgi:hypothetical protein
VPPNILNKRAVLCQLLTPATSFLKWFLFYQIWGMLKMKSEVTEEEIKREIISLCNDYKKLGIDISVKDIEIVYEDGVKYIKHNFDKD